MPHVPKVPSMHGLPMELRPQSRQPIPVRQPERQEGDDFAGMMPTLSMFDYEPDQALINQVMLGKEPELGKNTGNVVLGVHQQPGAGPVGP